MQFVSRGDCERHALTQPVASAGRGRDRLNCARLPERQRPSATALRAMQDLDVDINLIRSWFEEDGPHESGVLLVRTSDEAAATWVTDLVAGARRCYVTDDFLERRSAEMGVSKGEVLTALLPDPGAVMAGDFGEIVTFLFLGSREHPVAVIGPKKWRLKQDRRKPAPYSDVVQFLLPQWPDASVDDVVVCAEVKTKSTDGNSTPIASAIADSATDRVGRLAKTLAWLAERALLEDLGTTSLAAIQRFLQAVDHPPAVKKFWAVAVVCTSILEAELADAPEDADDNVIVIAVPELKNLYEAVFAAVAESVANEEDS
jgi:hypothetical protein